jgi:hypothetical protein
MSQRVFRQCALLDSDRRRPVKKLFGHRCTLMNTDENKCFICVHRCASVAICDFFAASYGRGSASLQTAATGN